jgi:ABC-type antimicrobial peptide transport system permease subunit
MDQSETSDLVEFLRLDPGAVLRKDPAVKAFKMVRIVAGNPLIMKRWQNASLMPQRLFSILFSFFGGLALVLSLVGLASTVSFAIAQRTNEIGIRMAWERSERMSCGSSFE